MGQTTATWRTKVLGLVLDEIKKDLTDTRVDEIGIKPAIAKYSVDRPRLLTVEVAGTGSAYLAVPGGWTTGFSHLEEVEYPARRNPPLLLDGQSWQMAWDPVDVTIPKILLDRNASVGQYVRLKYTAPWPVPTATAGDDLIDAIAFEAVASLAASYCLVALATQAARNRAGSLPADYTEDAGRAQALLAAAESREEVYNSFLGLDDDDGAGDTAPASRSLDFDPQRGSLFHGDRR